MEFVLIALAVGVLMFVTIMVGFWVGKARGRRHESAFQDYIAQHFPDLAAPAQMLLAGQQSKGRAFVALVVSEEREEIIVLVDAGREGIKHWAFPFSALSSVSSTNRIISRGPPLSRVYSYEQTMTVSFRDGTSIPFYLESVSNKHGTDQAPGLVAAQFAPWEEKLNGVLHKMGRVQVTSVATAGAMEQTIGTSGQRSTATPAAWYPDPTSRHQMRYWDGRDWTVNVADQGTQSTDPVETTC